MNQTNSPPTDLSKRIANTLDRSVEALDEATLTRLATAHKRSMTKHRYWLGSGIATVAASILLALAIMPNLHNTAPQQISMENDLAYLDVNLEFLSTMEMLSVLGEPANDL